MKTRPRLGNRLQSYEKTHNSVRVSTRLLDSLLVPSRQAARFARPMALPCDVPRGALGP